MKITIVPAQITTVEDRIIGRLSFSQMLLVIAPVFIGGALYGLIPPFMEGALYKYLIMAIIAFVSCILAIRIKGRIIAAWMVTILRYSIRPKFYLYNKNVTIHRQDYPPASAHDDETTEQQLVIRQQSHPRLGVLETAKVLAAIENPAANFRLESTKKGGLHARFTEIEE